MTRPLVVVVPGSRWDDVVGTDRQLATALAERVRVLWVDPGFPVSLPRGAGPQRLVDRLDEVGPGLLRLQLVVPPGASRPLSRSVAAVFRDLAVARAVRRLGQRPLGTLLASPQAGFPRAGGRRLLFVTDDWVAGAAMMGLSRRRVETVLDRNLRAAEVVAAVSPGLAELLERRVAGRAVALVPNGCPAPSRDPGTGERSGAVLLGQLNERLDLEAVSAVVDAGVEVTVIGPRAEREPATTRRLDDLLARPGVRWLGKLPHEDVADELDKALVGLTPYVDNAFNRSSFPLKTLEYLSAGLPVVSSDLPAARWLDGHALDLAASAEAFGRAAAGVVARPWDAAGASRRMELAAEHTWSRRAEQVLSLL